jgi:hypothetical protein
MAEDPLEPDRRTLAVIDGVLTQVSMALVCLVPTQLAVLFRPGLLRDQLEMAAPDGRKGVLLAPGPFFVIGLFSALVGITFITRDAEGAMISMGEGVASAAGAGEFWRVASIALPLFIGALVLGLIFFAAAQAWRLETRSLVASLRAAQYSLPGLLTIIFVAEPASLFIGPGGSNSVYEPIVFGAVGIWTGIFYAALLSTAVDANWRRFGAAVSIAVALPALMAVIYL